jgi:geranylgeranyl diphosphate synthase type II
MDLQRYLSAKQKIINDFLSLFLLDKKENTSCPDKLHDAMAYSLCAGGKRLRPILALASYEASGGEGESIVPVASAIEFIHTYSLIHDDLPAMDNDDLRRGRPTNHRVFGEAAAILAGDGLLTDAFTVISCALGRPETLLAVMRELSLAAGSQGMVGGQMVDIELEGKTIDKKMLEYIHAHKTGALIRASCRIGVIMAEGSSEQLEAITTFGENIGLAFQIVDDILDIVGSSEEMGKPAGSDVVHGKNTYPALYGLEKSSQMAQELFGKALLSLSLFSTKAEPLREIARYIIKRRK